MKSSYIPGALSVIIFDFDGVIVESNGIKDEIFQNIFQRYPEVYEQAYNYHTSNVFESRVKKFHFLAKLLGEEHNDVFINKMLLEFSHLTLEKMKSVSFVNGAKEFLQNFSPRLPLYLASVTPIEDLEIIVSNLDIRQYFKGIYGCPPWKKSDAVLDILRIEGTDAQNVILIGDSAGDQSAATIAGVRFIGRNSGLHFNDPQPVIFNDLAEIALLINETLYEK
jgi:phosphoglycolate phosphatase-like HAD superfamily hydrolase